MIHIRNKANFLFIFIIVVLLITVIIGFMCCDHESERTVEADNKTTEETLEEKDIEKDKITIDIETDKDGDINQAVEPDDEFIPLETEAIVESSTVIDVQVDTEPADTQDDNKNIPLFYLSDYERRVAECIVMGESGHESYEGQVLVAQCLLNACIKDGLQPSEARVEYQYRGWMDSPTDSVKRAVSAVFDDGYKLTDEFILYFYAPKYSTGKWHETQRFVIEVGGHRFFAEWGKE